METNIKLYGSKSDRFEELKGLFTERLGYEPSNSEVAGLLMARYESDVEVIPHPQRTTADRGQPLAITSNNGGETVETNIKLYGSKSDRFQEINDLLTERLGYEPSNSEVTGLLMAGYGSAPEIDHSRANGR